MKRELRYNPAVELRLQEKDGKHTVSGYAAIFDSMSHDLGGFRETINRGAFSRSLKANADVVALSEHDAKKGILGRTRSKTLRLKEDNIGLRFELDIADTQLGRDTVTSIQRQDLDSMSFGFVAQDADWDRSKGGEVVRSLKDVDLLDISFTGFPAYSGTSIQMRSLMFPDGEIVPEFRAEAVAEPELVAEVIAEVNTDIEDTDKLLASLLDRKLRKV
jgi:HK97 family phage prohead protease